MCLVVVVGRIMGRKRSLRAPLLVSTRCLRLLALLDALLRAGARPGLGLSLLLRIGLRLPVPLRLLPLVLRACGLLALGRGHPDLYRTCGLESTILPRRLALPHGVEHVWEVALE